MFVLLRYTDSDYPFGIFRLLYIAEAEIKGLCYFDLSLFLRNPWRTSAYKCVETNWRVAEHNVYLLEYQSFDEILLLNNMLMRKLQGIKERTYFLNCWVHPPTKVSAEFAGETKQIHGTRRKIMARIEIKMYPYSNKISNSS